MKFKDLWIKPDAAEEQKPVEPSASKTPQPQPSVQNIVQAATPQSGDISTFTKQLEDALEKANLPSQQDYLDFAKSLKNMESLPMDESTRFKAAYATLQSFGCNLTQLIESFDYYQGILDGEKDKFDEAVRSMVGETVLDKEKQIKQLSGENDDHAAEIQKLTAAIALNQQSMAALQSELTELNSRLEQRKAAFAAAYSQLKQRLQADETKLKTYLAAELQAEPPKSSRK
jgi:chromosome segregation ATPase